MREKPTNIPIIHSVDGHVVSNDMVQAPRH
jgi:hypothetical protein